jgi:hypothetical protein
VIATPTPNTASRPAPTEVPAPLCPSPTGLGPRSPRRQSKPVPASPRGSRTICLPIKEARYARIVEVPGAFRAWLDQHHRDQPELFPPGFAAGYTLKDARCSGKLGLTQRRIELRDGSSYSIRPSFVMPYLCARTDEVQTGLC